MCPIFWVFIFCLAKKKKKHEIVPVNSKYYPAPSVASRGNLGTLVSAGGLEDAANPLKQVQGRALVGVSSTNIKL